jgi:hypothetical protein
MRSADINDKTWRDSDPPMPCHLAAHTSSVATCASSTVA